MSENRIHLRHGSTIPSADNLQEYELGITNEGKLYTRIGEEIVFLTNGVGQKGEGVNSEIFNSYPEDVTGSNLALSSVSHVEGVENISGARCYKAESWPTEATDNSYISLELDDVTDLVVGNHFRWGFSSTPDGKQYYPFYGISEILEINTTTKVVKLGPSSLDTSHPFPIAFGIGYQSYTDILLILAENPSIGPYPLIRSYVFPIETGSCSHVEGKGNINLTDYAHVQGRYNEIDFDNKYAFIIGNGTPTNRSNAFAIGWDGNIKGESITLNNEEIKNFVIDSNTTTDGWYYEKWNNGIAKCYIKYTFSNLVIGTSNVHLVFNDNELIFPINFISQPLCFAQSVNQIAWNHILGNIKYTTHKIAQVDITPSPIGSSDEKIGGDINFQVIGKWK